MKNKEYHIFLSPPYLFKNEKKYIEQALKSNWIAPAGEFTKKFESLICEKHQVKFALALNSGTSALHLALKSIGIKAGDEVFCPTFTFIATANTIRYLGAFPIFIDSEEKTWNICPESLEDAIIKKIQFGSKPKAIIVTHIYGQAAQMDKLKNISQKYEISIIEDAAEALGTHFQGIKVGNFGKVGVLSFNGNKLITTSAGGALITNNESIYQKAKHLANQAKKSTIYFEHNKVAYNYTQSNLLSALGLAQLEQLDWYIQRKRTIFQKYYEGLNHFKEIYFLNEFENSFSNRWLSCILLKNNDLRKKVLWNLQNSGIESRTLWTPLHLQKPFKNFAYFGSGISENLSRKGLCLPSGVSLSKNLQEEIIKNVIFSINNYRK